MKPLILDVFTSSKNSNRPKQVFQFGESIQWNIVHLTLPILGEAGGEAYELYYVIQRYKLLVVPGEPHFELIFRLQKNLLVQNQYGAVPFRRDLLFVDPITIIPDELEIEFDPDERRDAINQLGLVDDDSILLLLGYWKFQAFLQLPDQPGKPFDASKEWHFKIERY